MKFTDIFFDFDGVIIDPNFIIDGLIAGGSKTSKKWFLLKLKLLNLWWSIKYLPVLYLKGEEEYIIKIVRDLALTGTRWYRGCDVDKVIEYYKKIRPITKGIKDVLKILKNRGIRLYVVSTMDTQIIKRYLKIDGMLSYFKEVVGCSIDYRDGKPSGLLDLNLKDNEIITKGKGFVVESIMKKYKILRENSAAVGDGETDIPMFLKVGTPVLFNPSKSRGGKSQIKRIKKILKKDLVIIEGTPMDLLNFLISSA